jgi:site-specific DNA-methyltransferase (adenine-specific)
MKAIPDGSVDLVVTSPPYDNLRSYNGNNDLWNEVVWKEVINGLFRIVKQGGVVVWVVGDAVVGGSETGTSFKQALHAMQCGFNLHDTMIYQKHNFSNPSSNRYHQIFEYMFIFSKGKPLVFNALKDRPNVEAGKVGSWGKNTSRQVDGSMLERSRKINTDFGMRYNIWRIKTEANPLHPAQYPLPLAQDHIFSWSDEGGTILDPFMGSGTTGVACRNLGRKFIGIEMNNDYFEIAKNRILNKESK